MAELTKLTLVAAMKQLKLIKKRMEAHSGLISQYATLPSNEKPRMGTEAEQEAEVKSLIQSNVDLAHEYESIHKALTFTNLLVTFTIGKKTGCINDFLVMRRELYRLLKLTYNSLNENNFRQRASANRFGGDKDQPVHCIYFFDEKQKQLSIRELDDMFAEIDSRLENINATTYLIDPAACEITVPEPTTE